MSDNMRAPTAIEAWQEEEVQLAVGTVVVLTVPRWAMGDEASANLAGTRAAITTRCVHAAWYWCL